MRAGTGTQAMILIPGLGFGGSVFSEFMEGFAGQYRMYAVTLPGFMAPRWFKTVTRETWDDNNFLPGDYAVNPVRGLRLWREAAAPGLHVWVRYLCEFNAQDITLEMDKLTVPTLILKPGLEGIYHTAGNNYMENYCHKNWEGSIGNNRNISVKTIPDSRVCLWFDQPQEVRKAVVDFLAGID
ncbi:hypothetical protein FBQ87_03480 [Sphingobacteriales bacterium CHB3]|nr:hypothetical protein [Sphingobacteriales bacterium CHB3]